VWYFDFGSVLTVWYFSLIPRTHKYMTAHFPGIVSGTS
jgi:hypothetical protein